MNTNLSNSQFQTLINGTKRVLDFKTIAQFVVYVLLIAGAFFTLRERVSLVENDVKHLTVRVDNVEGKIR